MDGHRFDALSKTLAGRSTRRRILTRLGGSGLVAGALTAGLRAAPARAAAAESECAIPLELVVRQGPGTGTAWRGRLKAKIDATGALTGVYTARRDEPGAQVVNVDPIPTNPHTEDLPVVGQANGHAISLMVTVADGQNIFGVGVLEKEIAQCAGAMGGPFVGPDPAATGSWAVCNYATCRSAGGTANFCSGVGLAYFCAEPR